MSLLEQLQSDRQFRKTARRFGLPTEADPDHEVVAVADKDGKPRFLRIPRGSSPELAARLAFEAIHHRKPSGLEMTLWRAQQLREGQQ